MFDSPPEAQTAAAGAANGRPVDAFRLFETLNRINTTLAAETDLEKVVQVVTDAGRELAGAELGAFFYNVLDERGESFTLYSLSGVPRDAFAGFPMPRNTDVFGPTFRGEGLLRLDDVTRDTRYGRNFPFNGLPQGHLPVRSFLSVPVISRSGEVFGGLFFGHSAAGVFGAELEPVMHGLAAQASIAIENARLYRRLQTELAERRRAEGGLKFLAQIGDVLASSLDYESTLAAVARLAVPQLADWCAVDVVVEGGAVQRLAVAHVDETKVELARELQERYPADPDAPRGVGAVIRTGRPELVTEIPDQMLVAATRDEEHLRGVRELGLKSYLCVPLISAREGIVGALTLVAAESGRKYDAADLEFAVELARRAAMAVDNARLYQAAQREIAGRRLIEESLLESEDRMLFTLDAAHVGTWSWEVATGQVRWSENMERLHGLEPGTFDGTFQGFLNDVHPSEREKVHKAIAGALEGNGRYTVEYQLAPKFDGPRWVEGKGRVIYDRQGRPARMAGICTDITERRRADEIRNWMAAIVESSNDAIIGKTLDGVITSWNLGAERTFGYTAEEAIGRPVALIVPAERLEEITRVYESLRFGRRIENFETIRLRKDGRRIHISLSVSPIQDAEGRVIGASGIERDITDRKAAEENLKRLNDELRQANHEMEQFVYTVSHDLKSPLVTISGFVGLLKEDVAAGRIDEVLDSVDRLERAAGRMNDLINDLLQLSRIGRVTHQAEPVDVGQLVREIADYLQPRLEGAGATLDIQPELPSVMADRVRLSEVFDNLLTNAIKYGCDGPNPRITMGSQVVEGEVRFFVRDNGPGIPADYHDRIFGLFQRLDSSREGTGVGLAIVARILQVLGGRAWVESAPGTGAAFWIALPAAAIVPRSV